MFCAYESFKAFFDIRHDGQQVYDGVRRFGRNNARLGNADITATVNSLLSMTNSCAFHRTLHGARAAACANVQTAQAELITYFFGVVIFPATDGVPTPANYQIWLFSLLQ